MNLSEEKRAQIIAALAKAQQDIQSIQAKGVLNSYPEMTQLFSELQDVVNEIRILTESAFAQQ